jgi:FkbM family methyltransferase
MDLLSFHTALRRLSEEFGVSFDYEDMLERQYRKFLERHSCVIDVGAHAGRHTRVFSEVCVDGHVIAVEPLPDQAETLRRLGLPNVSVQEIAAGDRQGRVSFVHAEGTPEESGLRARIFNHPDEARPRSIEVNMQRIDELSRDLPRCDYIKMDIEGAELTALTGAIATLRNHRPVISVEHGYAGFSAYGHAPEDLQNFAVAQGYVMVDLLGMAAHTRADWLLISGGWMWDFFMLPAERLSELCHTLQHP